MILVSRESDAVVVRSDRNELRPRDESQLAYWGFSQTGGSFRIAISPTESAGLAGKLASYFSKHGIPYRLDDAIQDVLDRQRESWEALTTARDRGKKLKHGQIDLPGTTELLSFLSSGINRPLKDHQVKAALHLWHTRNGANFSVPGSGKTSVVLAVFACLKHLGRVDSLFVVGPPACFGPWKAEYEAVLGSPPTHQILAGGDIDERRSNYLVTPATAPSLYLTTFQTLERDWEQVRVLFEHQGIKFFLVIDEAHYIKQIDGAWAKAVLNIAPYASLRCILTGTPFPRSYTDAFNLFQVLWPETSPIPEDAKHRIELQTNQGQMAESVDILSQTIGPLFYRVRKSDLGLAPQVFHPPVPIRMNRYERLAYDSILDRLNILSATDYARDIDLLSRLRRGRMMRLRQCLSYTNLLTSALTDYDEDLVGDDASLSDLIRNYNKLESPAKLETLMKLLEGVLARREKAIVWSNFVRTLQLIYNRINLMGFGVRLIYGGTPFHSTSIGEEQTREEILAEFTSPSSGIDVLVANPAACAESISLHKTCWQAFYYDLSYNCAQYLQSLDRIHRIGGSEDRPSHYYFLQYSDTIDSDILKNVQTKAENMNAVIEQDYEIHSMDMFTHDDELAAYRRLFGE